ncbi:hypothetical protein HA466_0030020 [Hirschfeldia incana]|nr:hypothetical protein HA466_0030020 [Hirschfeldia incana]
MAVPVVDLLNNSDEDFSDSELSYSSEDEPATETERKRREEEEKKEEEFWIKYPYLKSLLNASVAQGLIPEYYVYERAKLIGDEKAKELNERGQALFLKELEACRDRCEIVASAINAMKSVK